MNVTIDKNDIQFVEKIAGLAGMLDRLKTNDIARTALNAVGLMGLTSMGAATASSLYTKLKDKIKSHNAYKQMFEEFPELQEAPRTQVDKYWNVLDDFAPKLTTNPLVAGQFVSNMMQYGMRGIDHNTIGQLTSITKDINAVQNPSMLNDFVSRTATQALKDNDLLDFSEAANNLPPEGV